MNAKHPGYMIRDWSADTSGDGTFADQDCLDNTAPRDVFKQACMTIGDALSEDGFRYLRSRSTIKKVSGDLTFRIVLETSRWNIQGSSVTVAPYIWLDSTALTEWKNEHPRRQTDQTLFHRTWDGLVAAMIDDILSETLSQRLPGMCEWNIADPALRTDTIDDIVQFLRTHAVPYFTLFEQPSAVLERLIIGEKDCRGQTCIPGLDLQEAVEFALCFGTIEQASAVLFRHNQLLSNLQGSEVEKRFQTFTQAGLPKRHVDGPGFPREIKQIRKTWAL